MFSCDRIKKIERCKAYNTYEGVERCVQAFGREILKKYPHRRPNRRWVNNIKMNLQEVRWGHGRDWSGSGLCYVEEFSEGRNESSFAIKCGEFLDWGLVSFSKKKSVWPLTQPVKLKLDVTCILRVRATRTGPSLWPFGRVPY